MDLLKIVFKKIIVFVKLGCLEKRVGFCPSGILSRWDFIRWDFVLVGFCPVGFSPFTICIAFHNEFDIYSQKARHQNVYNIKYLFIRLTILIITHCLRIFERCIFPIENSSQVIVLYHSEKNPRYDRLAFICFCFN